MLKWFVLGLVLVLIPVLTLMYFFQDRLLYLPTKYPLAFLSSQAPRHHLRLWPSPVDYRGLLAEPGQGIRGTVLVTHGNAGSALDRTFYVPPLLSRGYRVILLEYPGYGPRPGKPSERTLAGDLGESIALARQQFGNPLFLIGESLGCGAAATAMASLKAPVAGVVLITPWDDLPSVAQSIYWFLPLKFLVRDKYDSVANLRQVRHPVAVILAEKDEVIPAKCSRRLLDSLSQPKKAWGIPRATHNSWPELVDARVWTEVLEFVDPEPCSLP
jgi:alpha-beta hydrolase superfamily lysophospholipase